MSKGLACLAALLLAGTAGAQTTVRGVVLDGAGKPLGGAAVQLANGRQATVAATVADGEGRFELPGVPAGDYALSAAVRGMPRQAARVRVPTDGPLTVTIDTLTQPLVESITVTAAAGSVELSGSVPQSVTVIDRAALEQRAKSVMAQAGQEEPGLALQRTSPTIGAIFVRGLTGAKVNVFLDGVRYSTGAARGGVSTFFDMIHPSSVESVEILRGPSSAQYGSDALGGSVQFRSPAPVLAEGAGWHGQWTSSFNTADAGFGSGAVATYGQGTFGLVARASGQRSNTLRTGGGIDSRSAATRFLGLPSRYGFEGRTPDTAFTQYGGTLRVHWNPGGGSQIVGHWQREQQDGGKRFDQLLGGDGNLIADLRNLMLDLAYLRYSKERLGWLDAFSATASFNAQREERVNQGGSGNPLAAVNHEPERTRVHGVQTNASRRLGSRWTAAAGGDWHHERIAAPSYGYSPSANSFTPRRGRVPDNSLYQSGGAWLQNVVEALPGRLRLLGNLRYSRAAYESRAADSPAAAGRPLWPDDSLSVDDVTWRAGVVATPAPGLHLTGNVGRGFRAPHVTDLGTLGLTGSGFEVAAPDVAGRGAAIGATAGADALSTGVAVTQVKPETSIAYDVGARFRRDRFSAEVAVFVNDIGGNIVKQTLILPPGAVGTLLGSDRITSQNANGAVFVAASASPVLVRANYDDARIRGVESRLEVKPARDWFLGAGFTWLDAHDRRTGLPPNIEGGTPPPNGFLRLRYAPASRRFWVEPYLYAADAQERLSSLDLSDRRTGAGRTRSSIAAFFQNGAAARGLVRGGILLATGETLAQVQNRVLGSASSAPLYGRLNGYATVNVRGGCRLGRNQELLFDLENLGDRNYRGVSWGVDAPGRGLSLRYRLYF